MTIDIYINMDVSLVMELFVLDECHYLVHQCCLVLSGVQL